jgi:hypothetical protein
MAHWPNSSRPALILTALMLRRMEVFDIPTARLASFWAFFWILRP